MIKQQENLRNMIVLLIGGCTFLAAGTLFSWCVCTFFSKNQSLCSSCISTRSSIMDASSLSPSELDEFFDIVEIQPNHLSLLFNSLTAICTRCILFSSLLLLQNEDEYSPFSESTIFQSPSRSPIPSSPPPMTLALSSTRKEYATAEKLLENINKEVGLQGYALAKRDYKKDKCGE